MPETEKSIQVARYGVVNGQEVQASVLGHEVALGPTLKVAEKSVLKIKSDKESIESMTTDPMTMGSQVLRGDNRNGLKGSVHMVSEMGHKEPTSGEEVVADQTKDWEVRNRKSERIGSKKV